MEPKKMSWIHILLKNNYTDTEVNGLTKQQKTCIHKPVHALWEGFVLKSLWLYGE
jgi:hypothetical protein